MLTNNVVLTATRFVLLVLTQVLIFNNLGFLGYINPMIYVLFVYWYPISKNRSLFLILCFALGFMVDLFSDSLALHSASILTVAFLRPLLMRFCFGANFEFQGFTYKNTTLIQRVSYLALLVFIHHTLFYTLEIFSFSHFLLILKKIISVGFISLFISLLISSLFASQQD